MLFLSKGKVRLTSSSVQVGLAPHYQFFVKLSWLVTASIKYKSVRLLNLNTTSNILDYQRNDIKHYTYFSTAGSAARPDRRL